MNKIEEQGHKELLLEVKKRMPFLVECKNLQISVERNQFCKDGRVAIVAIKHAGANKEHRFHVNLKFPKKVWDNTIQSARRYVFINECNFYKQDAITHFGLLDIVLEKVPNIKKLGLKFRIQHVNYGMKIFYVEETQLCTASFCPNPYLTDKEWERINSGLGEIGNE